MKNTLQYLAAAFLAAFAFNASAQITPGLNPSIGSAVGQFVQPGITSANYLQFSTILTNPAWTHNNGATVALEAITSGPPFGNVITSTSTSSNVSQTISSNVISNATRYVVSTYINATVIPASAALTNPSSLSRITVTFSGGTTPLTAYVDFNSITGNIVSSQNVSNINISPFNVPIPNSTSNLTSTAKWGLLTFDVVNNSTGNNAATVAIYPSRGASVGQLRVWGTQFDYYRGGPISATSQNTIVTGQNGIINPGGTLPSNTIFRSLYNNNISADYTVNYPSDMGSVLAISGARAILFDATPGLGDSSYKTITLFQKDNNTSTISSTNDRFFGPGIAAAGVTSFNLIGPGATVTLVYDQFAQQRWNIISGTGYTGNVPSGSALPSCTAQSVYYAISTTSTGCTYPNLQWDNANSQLLLGSGTFSNPSIAFLGSTSTGIYSPTVNTVTINTNGGARLRIYGSGVVATSGSSYAFSQSSSANDTPDTFIFRDAANTLAQRNGTNAQELRVYKTTTGPAYVSIRAAAPTIGSCGTDPSVNGSDSAMLITVGTGGVASSCGVTFSSTWNTTPVCVAQSDTDIVALRMTTTTAALTVTAAAPFTASSNIHVLCLGK